MIKNEKLFKKYGILDKVDFVYYIGRHTYFTNVPFNPIGIEQLNDNINNISSNKRQGGENVKRVIDFWLDNILKN